MNLLESFSDTFSELCESPIFVFTAIICLTIKLIFEFIPDSEQKVEVKEDSEQKVEVKEVPKQQVKMEVKQLVCDYCGMKHSIEDKVCGNCNAVLQKGGINHG